MSDRVSPSKSLARETSPIVVGMAPLIGMSVLLPQPLTVNDVEKFDDERRTSQLPVLRWNTAMSNRPSPS